MALRRAAVVLAVILGVAPMLAPSIPARGNQGVHFTKIRFDPPGRDDEHLEEEYVQLVNGSSRDVNLKGWTIKDLDEEDSYTFDRFILRAGRALRLHTGRRTSVCIDYCGGPAGFYWNRHRQIWDNERDRASIEKPDGRVVDRCGYGRSAHRLKRC